MATTPGEPRAGGLAGLRRGGSMTELLFLYECETLHPSQLRPVAERLGLTVQAASHTYRQLARRGLVALRDGRYRPTFEGVAWLHETLGRLEDDVRRRLAHLHVIRSTRAVALSDLRRNDPVSLEIRDGLLSARPGSSGTSRGRVARGGAKGRIVEVADLEGIVTLEPSTVSIRTLSESDLADPHLADRLRALVGAEGEYLAAEGLEPFDALRRATPHRIHRFAVGAAAREAARLGVPGTIVVMDRDLPRLLAEFSGPDPPPLDVLPLPKGARPSRGRRRA
ncbi:MAG: hypothetical protein HKL79_03720 [Thermoplasmata archaeon]|nr:hypothetical protein [Thermoplasmata archaeon]